VGSCCTIPGNSPPSATPSRARTATNDAKLRTKPKLIVSIPHTVVSNGSHMRGDIFLRTRLLGNSLGSQLCSRCMEQYGRHSPRNVGCVEDTQPDCELVVVDANVFLEAEDARIADVCAVDEGAEEQEGEDGEDAVGGLVETRRREGKEHEPHIQPPQHAASIDLLPIDTAVPHRSTLKLLIAHLVAVHRVAVSRLELHTV
jgi:hypothetical protein